MVPFVILQDVVFLPRETSSKVVCLVKTLNLSLLHPLFAILFECAKDSCMNSYLLMLVIQILTHRLGSKMNWKLRVCLIFKKNISETTFVFDVRRLNFWEYYMSTIITIITSFITCVTCVNLLSINKNEHHFLKKEIVSLFVTINI